MNKQTEALKMAIEALKSCSMLCATHDYSDYFYESIGDALKACKEALKPHPDCDEACMYQCEMERKHQQPAQEHIGYYYPDERMACLLFKKGLEIPRDALPLYGSPAPSWQTNKEFVLLSDDEIQNIADETDKVFATSIFWVNAFAHAIEQALKEKNT